MRLFFFAVIAAITFTSCSDNANNQVKTDTKITGELENYKGGHVVFERLETQQVVLEDTLQVDEDGSFSYYVDCNAPSFYRIRLGQQNFFNFIISPKDQITLTANADNLDATYQVQGSDESARLKELNNRMAKFYSAIDSVRKVMQQYQAQGDVMGYQAATQKQYQISTEATNVIKSFIDEKPGSMASLAAVQNLNPDQDFAYFEKVEAGLKSIAGNSSYYLDLKARVDASRKLAIGADAPDIALENPNGEIVKLSSLRGKVVLIDFWASWCKPCRMENPNVVKMYQKYQPKGFEIFGVSLDKTKDAWVGAIAQDQLTWTHVSDLKFWNSAGAKLYNVTSIPKTFLIDAEGKIIGKDLRGPALEAKLDDVFATL